MVRKPSAAGEADDAAEAVDARRYPSGVEERHVVEADEERRDECAERVHVEVVQRARHDHPPHRRDREDEEIRVAAAAPLADGVRFLRAAARLAHRERGGGAQQTGNSGDVERVAPAPVLQNPSAGAVREPEAERQAEHPDRDGARARGRRDEIADERRRAARRSTARTCARSPRARSAGSRRASPAAWATGRRSSAGGWRACRGSPDPRRAR